jgi:hypothetical protein
MLPPLAAEPEPGPIVVSARAPFDSVAFRRTDERGPRGWPRWEVYNLGQRQVMSLEVTIYVTDVNGKRVETHGHQFLGLYLDPGRSLALEDIGWAYASDVPVTARAYEVCVRAVRFAGESAWTRDDARCP